MISLKLLNSQINLNKDYKKTVLISEKILKNHIKTIFLQAKQDFNKMMQINYHKIEE